MDDLDLLQQVQAFINHFQHKVEAQGEPRPVQLSEEHVALLQQVVLRLRRLHEISEEDIEALHQWEEWMKQEEKDYRKALVAGLPEKNYYVTWIMYTTTLRSIHGGNYVRAFSADMAETIVRLYLHRNVGNITNVTCVESFEGEAPDEDLYVTPTRLFEE
jgi:hypothetical protein